MGGKAKFFRWQGPNWVHAGGPILGKIPCYINLDETSVARCLGRPVGFLASVAQFQRFGFQARFARREPEGAQDWDAWPGSGATDAAKMGLARGHLQEGEPNQGGGHSEGVVQGHAL